MKFELTQYNRNVPDEDLLNDLKLVASELKKSSLSGGEYKKYGKYGLRTISTRFGWNKALILAGLQIQKYHTLTEPELLQDLRNVSEILKKKSVTMAEYDSIGKYSSSAFSKFGTWFHALEKAGLEKTRNLGITNEELFENLEEIWTKLGRQPKSAEVQKPFSRYSVDTYADRFGSWRKALEAFVKFMNEDRDEGEQIIPPAEVTESSNPEEKVFKHKTKRNINLRLSWLIKQRDNFTCKVCGRSPALVPGTVLHVDHIKPYSKGGETVPENLQTLCMECNIGKSDLE